MKEAQIDRFKFYLLKFKEHMVTVNFSVRTIEGYMSHLKFFMAYLQRSAVAELGQINREVAYQYQLNLHISHGKCGALLSLETQNARLVAVRSFFKFMVQRGYFLYDPTAGLQLPKRKKNLPRGVMSSKEVFKVLNQPDADTPLGLRDKAILELLYSTGIRNSELRHLALMDVDTVCREVRVRQGKGRKDRVVPLGEIAARYVEEYLRIGRPKLLAYAETILKKGRQEPAELFISKGGKKITSANLITLVTKYVKRAVIGKHITCHGFRHTCATHMLKGKASLRHIQQMLGHGSIATTQIYTHVETGDLKKEHHRCHPREQAR